LLIREDLIGVSRKEGGGVGRGGNKEKVPEEKLPCEKKQRKTLRGKTLMRRKKKGMKGCDRKRSEVTLGIGGKRTILFTLPKND